MQWDAMSLISSLLMAGSGACATCYERNLEYMEAVGLLPGSFVTAFP